MGKNEKIHAKKLEKNAIQCIKGMIKEYNIKIKSEILYKKRDNFFFRVPVFLKYLEKDEKYSIYGRISVKPYILDDIFWDVFEIPNNKNEPESLRAIGAYVAPSIDIYHIKIEINEEDLEKRCEEFLNSFDKAIEEFLYKTPNIQEFIKELMEKKTYDCNELFLILLDIYEEKYDEAMIIINQELAANRRGGFAAGNKCIYEFAKEYCNKFIENQ